jgi:ribonuclease BN (tRNA processing enzyme)
VAREAGARRLTLIHLHPRADERSLLAAAPGAEIGRDGVELAL